MPRRIPTITVDRIGVLMVSIIFLPVEILLKPTENPNLCSYEIREILKLRMLEIPVETVLDSTAGKYIPNLIRM